MDNPITNLLIYFIVQQGYCESPVIADKFYEQIFIKTN